MKLVKFVSTCGKKAAWVNPASVAMLQEEGSIRSGGKETEIWFRGGGKVVVYGTPEETVEKLLA